MARPPGIPNKPKEKTKGAAPVTVAIRLKNEIEELKNTVLRLGAGLYEAHEMLLQAARKASDADMAYSAGELKGYLKNNGLFDQFKERDRQRMVAALEAELKKPESQKPTTKDDDKEDEEEGGGRVSSILGERQR